MTHPRSVLAAPGSGLPAFSRLTATALYELEHERGAVLIDPRGDIVAPRLAGPQAPMAFEDRLFLLLVEVLKGKQEQIESMEADLRAQMKWMTEHPDQVTEVHRVRLEQASLNLKREIDSYQEIFMMMVEIHKAQVKTWEMANQMGT